MSKLQQLDVFIGTNTQIGRLILPVGTETGTSRRVWPRVCGCC